MFAGDVLGAIVEQPAGQGMSDPAAVVLDGPLVVAALVAALAGLVSFLSPCVLPLVPGYLAYLGGLAGDRPQPVPVPAGGAEVLSPSRTALRERGTPLLGAAFFVLGFSLVFVSFGAAFGGLGGLLARHAELISRIAGGVTVVLGLAFLGAVPWLQRERRLHVLPRGRVIGGVVLGLTFGLGWTPCLGPTLAAVNNLAVSEASAVRGALLGVAYCAGLGVPFLLLAGGAGWATRLSAVARRHTRTVARLGGGLLVVIGLLLLTGLWTDFMVWLRSITGGVAVTPFGL